MYGFMRFELVILESYIVYYYSNIHCDCRHTVTLGIIQNKINFEIRIQISSTRSELFFLFWNFQKIIIFLQIYLNHYQCICDKIHNV